MDLTLFFRCGIFVEKKLQIFQAPPRKHEKQMITPSNTPHKIGQKITTLLQKSTSFVIRYLINQVYKESLSGIKSNINRYQAMIIPLGAKK